MRHECSLFKVKKKKENPPKSRKKKGKEDGRKGFDEEPDPYDDDYEDW